ncbi:unnamed protein product [marine sediment metagenome]|uniref:Uncharacterized protein n=1 Tax=marine sediment metagenome TaxID=412755 RepID=X1STZ1_9ZZZZ
MRTEQEVRELSEELSKLTGFIAEHGTSEQLNSRDLCFACDVCDTLSWVQGEISTDQFRSAAHLDLERLSGIAEYIETTTGRKLATYH